MNDVTTMTIEVGQMEIPVVNCNFTSTARTQDMVSPNCIVYGEGAINLIANEAQKFGNRMTQHLHYTWTQYTKKQTDMVCHFVV